MRLALRQLAKSPGFAFVAIATFALGIGACTAIFTVVNSVLLRPLAYPDSGRLVLVQETKLPQFPQFDVAPGNYHDLRTQATSFAELAALRAANFNLTGSGEPVRITGERVTPNYVPTLGLQPLLGRNFSAEEASAKAPVALLSYGLWMRQFGGQPEVVNQTIHLDDQVYTIVGVLPESFDRGGRAEIFTPADYAEDHQNHGGHYLRVIGRLKPGVTLEQATTEVRLIAARLEKQYPGSNTGWSMKLTPLFEAAVRDVRPILYSLLGAVGFLLVIACANVANLLLARASARAKEISIRAALGATRGRIVRQLLVENMLLAGCGGILGLLLAQWGMHALLALAPADLPRLEEIGLDGRALGFTCALAVLSGIGFGLAPAFHASRINLNETLKECGRGPGQVGSRQRLRGVLAATEIAVALMLLVGSGLLIRSFTRLLAVDPGFQPRDALAVTLSLPDKRYTSDSQKAEFAARASARLADVPNVECVGATNMLPLSGQGLILAFEIEGHPAPPPESGTLQTATFYSVTPDYFRAMGIRLLRGRLFAPTDSTTAPPVTVISEALARQYFRDEDPIGRRLNLASGPSEIVGVVADVKHDNLAVETRPQTYVPFAQVSFGTMSIVVRPALQRASGGDSVHRLDGIAAAIRTAIHDIDANQPIASIRPLSELVSVSIARQRFAMTLFAVFSCAALLLASIGLYGVMAYSVSQRTAEFGIRLALGAQRADVMRLVLARGVRLIASGLAAGVIGALVLTRLLSSMLFGISAHDPLTFVAIALLLAAVATLACLIPARRATKLDPLTALRAE